MITQKVLETEVKNIIKNISNMSDKDLLNKFYNDKYTRTRKMVLTNNDKLCTSCMEIKIKRYKIKIRHKYNFNPDNYEFNDKINVQILRFTDTLSEFKTEDSEFIELYIALYNRVINDIIPIVITKCFDLFINKY